jgi:uncharacterized cupredoxin-like copper-binding protein
MCRFPSSLIALIGLVVLSLTTVPTAAQEATPAAGARCPSPLDTAASPVASPVGALAATPQPTEGEPVCVGVLEGEFYIEPARTTFRVGEPYVFSVGNAGLVVHEFVIEPAGSTEEAALEAENGEEREAELEDIQPGQTAELVWTFDEPGRYQFACHLADHFERGMVIEIEVTE